MKIAVLGSGNGGCAVAADFALNGHDVYMFDFEQFSKNINAINQNKGIHVEGVLSGFGKIKYAGHDMEKVVKNADLIFVVGPAYSTKAFAEASKNYIEKNQQVIVCPGSCGGSLVFKNELGLKLKDNSITVSETSTLPYACRVLEPGTIHIYLKLEKGVFLGAIPSKRAKDIVGKLKDIYPSVVQAENIIQPILQNANPIIHPAVTLLNAALIERTKGDFYFYEDGATPCVGKLIEKLDKERIAIGKKFNLNIIPDTVLGKEQGYMQEENYETGYSSAKGFKGIKAQSKLDYRYFNEDVGYGLVFMSELAKEIGIEVSTIDSIINIVSVIMNKDYRKIGSRTPSSLGLKEILNEIN